MISETPPTVDRHVVLGIITSPHGVRGDVKIKSYMEDPTDIASFPALQNEEGSKEYHIKLKGQTKELLIASVEGVTTREDAAKLARTKLCIARTMLPPPEEEDAFLIEDLVGLAVILEDDSPYGSVKAVHNFGAGDILELLPVQGKSEMVLFTHASFPEVTQTLIRYTPPDYVKGKED